MLVATFLATKNTKSTKNTKKKKRSSSWLRVFVANNVTIRAIAAESGLDIGIHDRES
jgi:hypothetical protein